MRAADGPVPTPPIDPTGTVEVPSIFGPTSAPGICQVRAQPSASGSSTVPVGCLHAPRRQANTLDDEDVVLEEDEVGSPWDIPWD